MKEKELISVVVGSYNGADFLQETVDSILNQTYKNIELILVDDGSKDNTLEIMNMYKEKDARVKVLHHENSGASATREAGYNAATGDYIILSDDDDVWNPNMLEEMMELAYDNKDADAIVTFNKHIRSGSEISNYDWNSNKAQDIFGEPKKITGREYALEMINKSSIRPCVFWGSLFKRDFFDRLYPQLIAVRDKMPTHYFNDSYASSRIYGIAQKVILTNRVHILYRICPESLSHKNTVSAHVKYYIYAGEEGIKLYKSLGWNDVYEEHLINWYLVLLKSWFRVYAYENDEIEKSKYCKEVRRLYDLYLPDLKHARYREPKKVLMYLGILLWDKYSILWFRMVRRLLHW